MLQARGVLITSVQEVHVDASGFGLLLLLLLLLLCILPGCLSFAVPTSGLGLAPEKQNIHGQLRGCCCCCAVCRMCVMWCAAMTGRKMWQQHSSSAWRSWLGIRSRREGGSGVDELSTSLLALELILER
jgi:hypothetical protein